MGDYYESESPARKEYIAKWLREGFRITKGMTLNDFKIKLDRANKLPPSALSEKQNDILLYLNNEDNLKRMVEDSFKRAKRQIKTSIEEDIKNKILDKGFKTKKVKNRNYKLILENNKTKSVFGFVREKRVKTRIETYLKKGEIKLRLRDSKGRFAKFSKD